MWRIVVRRMVSAADIGKSFAGIFEISRWAETPEGLHENITASLVPKVEETKTKQKIGGADVGKSFQMFVTVVSRGGGEVVDWCAIKETQLKIVTGLSEESDERN